MGCEKTGQEMRGCKRI